MSQIPTLNELSYQQRQLVNDMTNHELLINSLSAKIDFMANTLLLRRTYLKQLLIYKAQQKLPNEVNDYVSMLCSIYKKHPEVPDMNIDTTPGWLVADAVITEKKDKDRLAFTDIFIYAYGYHPQIYFQ
jgi:hypothetical protein